MYKGCIFDLDGTLTDTLESLTYSVNETLKEMKLPAIEDEQCRMFVGNGARVLLEKSLKAAGDRNNSRIDEAMERYGRIFGENCTYHVEPYDGIRTMLGELKSRGIKIAVLSNKPHQQAVDVVENIFGKGIFTYVLGQCDDIPRKPDPSGVFVVLDKMHLNADECLYIGDSEVDIATGSAAGVDTVGVEWGFRSKEVLKRAGAAQTIEKPSELLSLL